MSFFIVFNSTILKRKCLLKLKIEKNITNKKEKKLTTEKYENRNETIS
jgi:hypothetical protein